MSIHINQVLEYLDTHPVCQEADNMESLLDMLYDVYATYNYMDREEIQDKFRQLRDILNQLPTETFDAFFSLVCDLCIEHEQLAFSQGIVVGMLLMTEVNRVP